MRNKKSIGLRIAMTASLIVSCQAPFTFAATTSSFSANAEGHSVTTLQQALSNLGYPVGTVDGQFGAQTFAALEAFQRDHHLPVTGMVDMTTWTLITSANSTQQATTGSPSNTTTPSRTTTSGETVKITNFRLAKIYFANKLMASPHAFTAQGTTYMPIWYLMQSLKSMNIQSTWNGSELALKTPSSTNVDLSNITVGHGVHLISINGTPITHLTGIPYVDPSTNNLTQYMPIWYLQRVLTRLNIQSTWNGTEWAMTQPMIYTAFSVNAEVLGTFTSLDDAKKVLSNSPLGTVKDDNGNVVYTQPAAVTYTAYTSTGSVIGTFSSLSDAKQALAKSPLGIVKDSNNNVVYTQPQATTYTAYFAGGVTIGTFASLTDAKTALTNNPGAMVKDSTGKLVYTQPIPYTVFDQTGAIVGLFAQLTDAQTIIKDFPGSSVKDSSGNTIASEPLSTTYSAYSISGAPVGTFGSLSNAELSITNSPGGIVKDADGNVVYTQPTTNEYQTYYPNGVAASSTTYTILDDAETAVANIPGGYIKNASGNVLYVTPIQQPYASFTKSGALVGVYSTITDAEQALSTYPGGTVNNSSGSVLYTQPGSGGGSVSPNGFQTVDLRYDAPSDLTASAIDQYLTAHGSFMAGLGQDFIYAQNTYGVNANYLVSHAIQETGWVASPIALAKDNMYGYGAYDTNPGTDAGRFPSYEYDIRFQAWEVRQNYLSSGSSLYVTPTLQGMNVHYATDQRWAAGIGALMSQLASTTGDSVSDYQQYTPSNQPPAASSSSEPVFRLNGARAVVSSAPYYPNLPYYSDWATGNNLMFVRILQSGQNGGDVSTLQRALNQKLNAGLVVDGSFGPMTAAAVRKYQQNQGLTATGTCDFQLWSTLVQSPSNTISANTSVTVDQMMQGMSAGLVVEWYHIPNYGWVNSEYVKFTNTYRLTVSNPASPSAGSLPIYSTSNHASVITTMHAGDWVVSPNPSAVGGFIQIQFVNQQTGQLMQGVIDASKVQLTAIQ